MQPSYRPVVESLEKRELLASGLQAYVTGGNLYVLGSAASDDITISQSSNNQISVAGMKIGANNGQAASVNASSIANVYIYGNGGNDVVNLATLKVNALVYGSSGNDTVVLGTGNDTVNNGGGFDWTYRPYKATSPRRQRRQCQRRCTRARARCGRKPAPPSPTLLLKGSTSPTASSTWATTGIK